MEVHWGESSSMGGVLDGVVEGCCVCERHLCVFAHLCVHTCCVSMFQLLRGLKVTVYGEGHEHVVV